MRYVRIDVEPDGSAFNVSVPSLPGCFTWGETLDEALANAQEAIDLYIESLVQLGEPVPPEDVPEVQPMIEVVPVASPGNSPKIAA